MSSNSSGRRLVLRPGGQYVLSRHSNSPFQPRIPLHVEPPPAASAAVPAIPSPASSFLPPSRLLYHQFRQFLSNRIRNTAEPSSSDSTTNYSSLAREPDVESVIGNPTPEDLGESSNVIASDYGYQSMQRNILVLSNHIDSIQRLVRYQ